MDTDIRKTLMKKAGAYLARRAYSRNELKSKLAGMADNVQIEAVLHHLEQLNLLNDSEYAYNFALHRMRQQGWSSAKVQCALLRLQVCMPAIESALNRIQAETGDTTAAIMDYVRQRCGKPGLPGDARGVRRLILHLRRRGFDEDQIYAALRELIPAATLQPFDTGE